MNPTQLFQHYFFFNFIEDLMINEFNIMDKWNENEQKRSVQALLLELQESEIKYSDGKFFNTVIYNGNNYFTFS